MQKQIKAVAAHEAGHGVAHAFLGDNYTDLSFISIINNNGAMGGVKYKNIFFTPDILPMRRASILCLSGPVAEEIKFKTNDNPLGTGCWKKAYHLCTTDITEEEWFKYHDIGKAWCNIMKDRHNSKAAPAIMRYMEKWTLEMLNRNDVRSALDALFEKLLEKGIIYFNEYDKIVKTIRWKSICDPVWRRRLHLYDDIVLQRPYLPGLIDSQ
ncbi:MAG: hypothetical protein ACLFPI_10735 [Desulfobacterales bacterium]